MVRRSLSVTRRRLSLRTATDHVFSGQGGCGYGIGRLKIAIVGTGAMGSVYAGILGDAGNEVWAVDVWAEHVDAMRTRGLMVEGASGSRTVRIEATSDPAEVGVCDLVVIATKAVDVEAAA